MDPHPTPPSPITCFLDLIAWSEATSTSRLTRDRGYDVIVTGLGGPEIFIGYADHPFAHREPKLIRLSPRLLSTASGRYQILLGSWRDYQHQLALPDFSPDSQDKVAVAMIQRHRALHLVEAGMTAEAITLCSTTWASFPGNPYGQPSHSLATLLQIYQSRVTERQA